MSKVAGCITIMLILTLCAVFWYAIYSILGLIFKDIVNQWFALIIICLAMLSATKMIVDRVR